MSTVTKNNNDIEQNKQIKNLLLKIGNILTNIFDGYNENIKVVKDQTTNITNINKVLEKIINSIDNISETNKNSIEKIELLLNNITKFIKENNEIINLNMDKTIRESYSQNNQLLEYLTKNINSLENIEKMFSDKIKTLRIHTDKFTKIYDKLDKAIDNEHPLILNDNNETVDEWYDPVYDPDDQNNSSINIPKNKHKNNSFNNAISNNYYNDDLTNIPTNSSVYNNLTTENDDNEDLDDIFEKLNKITIEINEKKKNY